jgi:Ion channel
MAKPEGPKTREVVRQKARALIAESWQSQANLTFFLGLAVALGFVLPVLGFGKNDEILYSDFCFTLMIISGVAIAWGRPWLFGLAAFVGSVTIAVRWMAFFTPTATLQVWSGAWSVATILVISLILLAQVFRAGPVTRHRLEGAIAVYLLFGVGWAHAYHLTGLLHPGSFNTPQGEIPSVLDWVYFSFITLTTVGYGDIVPVRPIARTLAMGEALTGQLYLAVLVARLVAMEVVTWQEKTSRNSQ